MTEVFSRSFVDEVESKMYDEMMSRVTKDAPKIQRVFNGKGAAKYLGVSPSTFRDYVKDGYIKPFFHYNSSRKMYDIQDLDKFIEMEKEGVI